MATTARFASWTPRLRSASVDVASASTASVRLGAYLATSIGSRSIASTSLPRSISCSATAEPNRPSPTTTTVPRWILLAIAVSFLAGSPALLPDDG